MKIIDVKIGEEIHMLDRKEFFKIYKVEKEFENSGLNWGTLESIYDDYVARQEKFEELCKDIEQYLRENVSIPIHSIRVRKKILNI